jgi:glutamyl-tRNA reductase
MRRKAEQIREAELERTLRHLGEVDPQTLAHIQYFSRYLVNKLLHDPTLFLKQKAGRDEAATYAATVRELFGLSN